MSLVDLLNALELNISKIALHELITKLFAQEAEVDVAFMDLGMDLKVDVGLNKEPHVSNLLQAYEQVD